MTRNLMAVLALTAAFALAAPTLAAAKDKDKGEGKGHGHANKAKFEHENNRHGDDDDRWERREGHEYRVYGDRDGRPPGWSRGRKAGWRDCGLPPGQAKKYGCRTYLYGGRRYYYYQDERARIIVRRPIIVAEGSVVVR